jgi:uncharacterized protein
MSKRLPERVDPYRLADQRRILEGDYALEKMPRLVDAVEQASGQAHVSFEFNRSPQGYAEIKGHIEAELVLVCQRCLGPMDYSVYSKIHLAIVPSDALATQLQNEIDTVVIPEEMFLRDFIEDELMLSLPLIPRHEREEDCDQAASQYLHIDFEQDKDQQEKKENPFSVLSELKTKH